MSAMDQTHWGVIALFKLLDGPGTGFTVIMIGFFALIVGFAITRRLADANRMAHHERQRTLDLEHARKTEEQQMEHMRKMRDMKLIETDKIDVPRRPPSAHYDNEQ